MRSVRMLLMMALMVVPRVAQAQPVAHPAPMTISAQSPLPAPTAPVSLAPLTLLGFALVGATEKTTSKTRKMNLSRSYLFDNQTFGPGADVVVPDDFPDIDGETGDVIFPEGSKAAANQARARSFSTPPNTGGVNTGSPAGGGTPPSELEDMTKEELQEEAAKRGLTVTRGDGGDGEPLKADYVKALST
jgi:hypothetical protein